MKTVSTEKPVSILALAYRNDARFAVCHPALGWQTHATRPETGEVYAIGPGGKLYTPPPAHMVHLSLADVEWCYREGRFPYSDLVAYLKAWNESGTKFTRAIWRDGAIRQFDPENSIPYAKETLAEFGADAI